VLEDVVRERGSCIRPYVNIPEKLFLLRWLNRDPALPADSYGRFPLASRRRVISLLRDILALIAMLRDAAEADPDRDFSSGTPPEVKQALGRIQDVISDYSTKPRVHLFGERREGLRFGNITTTGRPAGERIAVESIMDLVDDGVLFLIRQCACENWFRAKRADQTACSTKCRHRKYEQTESFKAMRRKYMREYYALKKSGKVK
jgi:hypothetical protein